MFQWRRWNDDITSAKKVLALLAWNGTYGRSVQFELILGPLGTVCEGFSITMFRRLLFSAQFHDGVSLPVPIRRRNQISFGGQVV